MLFWANGLQGNFLRVKSASNELCSMIHCKVGTRVASYWYRFANARPQNSRQKLAWLAFCKTLAQIRMTTFWQTAAHPTAMESLKSRMQARDDAAATPPPPPAKATTTVAARVRPWLAALDGPNDIASTSAVSATGVRVRSEGDAGRGRGFRLHHAVSADDATFCETVIAPLADLASKGGTACVVFYGASGAGKTHSARAAQRFAAERLLKSSTVDVSFLEIAGESCCDLLEDRSSVKLLADSSGTIQPVGLSKNQCTSIDDFDLRTKNANKLRATAATERNSVSSRSHAVCQLKAGSGRLRLVDLAGSERLKAGAENYSDERLREAQEINSSLSCLNECLRARLRGDKHVPYRRAKITLLLRDALEVDGATSTAFVACVSPSPDTATESKRTLEYAAATLEASELARQRKQFKGPEKWSSKECEKWCRIGQRPMTVLLGTTYV